jgi:hypothetical protein
LNDILHPTTATPPVFADEWLARIEVSETLAPAVKDAAEALAGMIDDNHLIDFDNLEEIAKRAGVSMQCFCASLHRLYADWWIEPAEPQFIGSGIGKATIR